MKDLLLSSMISIGVGVIGTGLGGVIALKVRNSNRLTSTLMGISAGIMLSIVFLEMVPEALELSDMGTMLLSAVGGAMFVLLLHLIFPHHEAPSTHSRSAHRSRRKSLMRTGIFLCIGIGIHNLPEGMAIGSGLESPGSFGYVLALMLLLHDIPEGMAMALPLKMGGIKKSTVLWLTMLAGLPTVLGAIIGTLISNISEIFIGACIAFGAGAMLYITVRELIPESLNLNKDRYTVWAMVMGFIAGAAIAILL